MKCISMGCNGQLVKQHELREDGFLLYRECGKCGVKI